MSYWGQISFQDAASPVMQILIGLHDHAMLILLLVIGLVSYAMLSILLSKLSARNILQNQHIETLWTILPAVVLLVLALPSLRILYLMDEVANPSVTIKAIGHQWYWSYEYSDFGDKPLSFDSYMVSEDNLNTGDYRLLEVDNRAVIPQGQEIRVVVTSADVIHSWAVPSLGVNIDAVPGRLNQIGFQALRPGIFYGQCSEICGANHSFMPIAIEVIEAVDFAKWATSEAALPIALITPSSNYLC